MNSSKKAVVEDKPAPDRNDEHLLYQTLLTWPAEPPTAQAASPSFASGSAAYITQGDQGSQGPHQVGQS